MSVDDLEIRTLPQVECSEYFLDLFRNSTLLELKTAQDYNSYITGATVAVWPIYFGGCVGVALGWLFVTFAKLYLSPEQRALTLTPLGGFDKFLQFAVIIALLCIPATAYESYRNMLYVDLKLRTLVFALRELELNPSHINLTDNAKVQLAFNSDVTAGDPLPKATAVFYGLVVASGITMLALWLGVSDARREAVIAAM